MSSNQIEQSELPAPGLSWQNPPTTLSDGLKVLGDTIRKGSAIIDQMQSEMRDDNFEEAADTLNELLALLTEDSKAFATANERFDSKTNDLDQVYGELKSIKKSVDAIDLGNLPTADNVATKSSTQIRTMTTNIQTILQELTPKLSSGKIPSTTGLATAQDVRNLEQKLPKTDGLATTQNIQDLVSALPKVENIQKGLATSAEIQGAFSKINPPSLADIRKDLTTETQFNTSLGQVNSTLKDVPDKVVERLLNSDNFKTAVQHPSFPAVNELQQGLATQSLVQGVPQAVRAALLNPSSDPESDVQPPALVTMHEFDAFKTEIRQEIQSLPKGATMGEIKAHLDQRATATSVPPPPAGVTASEFETFKGEIKGMIQAIPTTHPVPAITPATLNTFKEEVKQTIDSIPRGPTLEQIANLLQSQFRQQPQTGTGTTSRAQDATSSTTQSASTSQPGNQPSNSPGTQGATASSTQSASTSQAQDQTPGAARPERRATSQTGFTFEPPNPDTAQVHNPFSASTENVASPLGRVQEQDTRSVGDKRPVSPTAEQSEAQKMARTIDSTIQEGNAQGVTDLGSSTTQTRAPTANQSYLVIDVSTRGRVADSCLDQVFKELADPYPELAEGSWRPPRDMEDPNIDTNSWLGKIKTCIQRDTKQKLAAGRPNHNEETYTSPPRCYIGEIQKKPCVSEAREKWTWTKHDANFTCPACSTAHPDFKSHQCLKVKDEKTLWLLNPTPEDINTRKDCDDKYRGVPRGDVAPGASRSAGPGPGAGGAGGRGGPASGGPASGGLGSRRGGRARGFSNASMRTTRSRTSRGGTAETHDDMHYPVSPSKGKKSLRQFLHLKPKESKSALETEARFQDIFAERPEQSGSRLPFRPGTLPTSHSVNFDTLQTRPMDPSKSGKLQRSKSGASLLNTLGGYMNPTNWLSRGEGSNLASESRVGLLASEQNGGHENRYANGHANGHANGVANGYHDYHPNGHNGRNENGSFEDPLGAGDMFPATRGTSSHHFGTI
ncbi:hypothetical protein KCU74_g2393, partial [Aureobasidium melanogenum]